MKQKFQVFDPVESFIHRTDTVHRGPNVKALQFALLLDVSFPRYLARGQMT